MLLCLLLTLSTSNLLTCQLVHSSTLKTLFLCYFVFYLPCLQATRYLVYSLTCQLLYRSKLRRTLITQDFCTVLFKTNKKEQVFGKEPAPNLNTKISLLY